MKEYVYRDVLNDDFAGNNIKSRPLPDDYRYLPKTPLRRGWDFFLHHFLVTPLVFLFQKIVFHEHIVNRKVLRPYLKTGFYLYGNHTRSAGDAFTPHLVSFPRKAYILVNSDAVAIPVLRDVVASLGGVPLPDSRRNYRSFRDALKKISENGCVCIYPEAHIWPYYTDIRPFRDGSFHYPAEYNKPVFCFTVTYKKRRFLRFPCTVVYVDGPFFPDPSLDVRQNRKLLRNRVYETMKMRSAESDYAHCRYIDRTEGPEEEKTGS